MNEIKPLGKNEVILNLKQALDLEYKALEGYEQLFPEIEDSVDQDRIKLIIEDERKHIEIVEGLIDMINFSHR